MTTQLPTVSYDNIALVDSDQRNDYSQGMQQQAFVYQIKGRPAFAYGDVWLQKDQRVIADSTAMLWVDGDIEIQTNMPGGICAAWMRTCSGEPCCFNTYVGTGTNQKVTFGFELPGDLMAFGVSPGNGWCLTFDAFVAGTDNLIISSRFSGCCACYCGDEAPFITKATVKTGDMGILLAGGYGMVERHDVPQGQTLLVSRGLFFAAREDSSFDMGLVGGLMNLCCTGSGIVFKFHGPCAVYTQSKNPVQLYRDFGIPGGNPKYQKAGKAVDLVWKILKAILKGAASAQG